MIEDRVAAAHRPKGASLGATLHSTISLRLLTTKVTATSGKRTHRLGYRGRTPAHVIADGTSEHIYQIAHFIGGLDPTLCQHLCE
jgi:hypothetical protein